VIRLRGNGRVFCAGRDISALPTERDLELVQGVAVAIVRHPKPVVAAVHGWTVGAGLSSGRWTPMWWWPQACRYSVLTQCGPWPI